MKSQFSIFGLEPVATPNDDDDKAGQPEVLRKYPLNFETFEKAHEELLSIQNGSSAFPHYKFDKYVVLEVYSADKKK